MWATVSSWSCFCWLYRASPSSAAKNVISLISVGHLVTSMCRVFSWVVSVFAMASVCSWQNSFSLCLDSLCTPEPKFSVTPGIPFTYDEKNIFWGVLVLEGLVGHHIRKLKSWHPVPSLHGKYVGKPWKWWQTLVLGLQNHCSCLQQPWNYNMLTPWKKSYDQPTRQHIKKQRHSFANKDVSSQSYSFSSRYEWMWELDHKESWALKNWCFWTVVLEKTLDSPLDCKEIKPVNSKDNPSEYSLEGLMLKLKLQYFGYLMWRTSHCKKTLMLGKMEGRRIRGQQRMRWLGGITNSMYVNFSSSRVGDGQGSLVCCSSWGRKESDMTEWLKWPDTRHWATC